MKYFVLVCFLLIMSCKSGKDTATLDSVIEIAYTKKIIQIDDILKIK